jgi:hypothetical protein
VVIDDRDTDGHGSSPFIRYPASLHDSIRSVKDVKMPDPGELLATVLAPTSGLCLTIPVHDLTSECDTLFFGT